MAIVSVNFLTPKTNQTSAAMVRISLKASSSIKPAEPTPNHRLWLSDFDLLQPFTHAPLVFFYPPNNNTPTFTFFSPDIMKTSLSRALVHFYPFAGRLVPGRAGRLELDCKSSGVLFCEAECDAEIADFGDFKPSPDLRSLVPHVDYNTHISGWPLLIVQLTSFRCGGVCLGVGVCHTASDGHTLTHFISTWAMIARGGGISVEPVFDRTVLRARDPPVAPTFDHEEFKLPPRMMGSGDDDSEERRKETAVAMLKLTREQVESIRRAADEGRDVENVPKSYSRYEAVAGYVWRCTCVARRLHPDQPTKLYVAVNGRYRFRPPLPKGYFGNGATVTATVARSGDIVSGHLSVGASRIRAMVERVGDEYLRSALDFLSGQRDFTPFRRGAHTMEWGQATFYGCPNLTLTSWLGMPLYDSDFGWGPPEHVGPASLGFEGKAYVVPRSEEEGGIIIALRLHAEHMKTFERLFYSLIPDASASSRSCL